MTINFIPSKDDNDEEFVMHSKSVYIEIMINDKEDEVTEEFFKSLSKIYQIGLERSMRGSNFIFDCVLLLYNNYLKINFSPSESYIDSVDWVKNKKATINPVNKKDKCFQWAVTVALNHEAIEKDLQKFTKIKLFINRYSWEGMNFPSKKKLIGTILRNII